MKIAISGTHSTGKSTLIDKLEPRYPTIKEIARDIINRDGKLPQDMNNMEKLRFHMNILVEQIKKEDELGDFISDRSVYDCLAYSRLVLNKDHLSDIEKMFKLLQNKIRYDIIFYIPIEFNIDNDGVRFEGEEFRSMVDKELLQVYKDYGVNYYKLSGTVEDRLKQIQDTIREFDK